MDLLEGEKSVAHKRENLHISVVFATHTSILKLDSENMWELESLRIRFELPHMNL